jgi:general secretion pathway protein L
MATILGLDIDPQAVRGVVLRTALRKSEVVRYVSVPIEPEGAAPPEPAPEATEGAAAEAEGAAEPAPPSEEERVRRALRSLLAQIGQPPDKVITELSGDEVSIRKVALPAKAAKKLDELLPFELEGKVPFEPLESVVDHQPIETVEGELSLLAAVAPKERVRAHLDRMKSLGLEPREVAVGAVALDGLVPLLPELQTPGPHCLIDIHVEGTDVCILQNGACHFARTLSVRIDDLDQGRQALLERELRQTLAAWRMEGGPSPSTFHVCGAMAVRQGTDAWLSQIVGAPVENLRLPSPAGWAEDPERPAFARAAALAGRALNRGKHLDVRRGEFAAQQTVTALRQHLPLLAACAAVVVAAFVFSSYARYSVLEARNQQLQDELARVTEDYFGMEASSAQQALRLLSRGARGNDPMPRFDAYHALAAISGAIPEDVRHDVRQLQIDLGDGEETGRFSLRGVVDTVAETDRVLSALESHRWVRGEGDAEERFDCFHEVELVGNTSATADDRRSYRLEGDIHCEPEGAGDDDDDDEEDE